MDLVGRRRQAHQALPVQSAVLVDVPQRKREGVLRSEHGYALSIRSWAISSVSMATSVPFALKSAPSHFVGHASKKFHRSFSVPSRSLRMMLPLRRDTILLVTSLYQA